MGTDAKKDNAKSKKIVKIVLNVLLWIFLVFAFIMMVFAFASISNDYGVPVLGKKVILNVVSDSMEPTIKKGDMITGTVLTLEQKKELKEGDIITYFADIRGKGVKEVNTHRIKSITELPNGERIFRTKGDNESLYNGKADDGYDLLMEDVICTWKEGDTQLHGMGAFLGFLQSRVGFLCIVVIPLALFFIYEVVHFVFMVRKIKGKDSRSISDAEKDEIRRQAIEEYRKSLADGTDKAEASSSADDTAEGTDKGEQA